jgi:uncharacterized cupin superfamily protein
MSWKNDGMTVNIFNPEWDVHGDQPYQYARSRVGRRAGACELGASLFEMPPNGTTFPLHIHHANEELLVVLSGHPTLRTLEGERELVPGEVVAFKRGRRGAHRLDNHTDSVSRFLIISTMNAPDINEFPETGEFWLRDYPPGSEAPPNALDVRLTLG